MQTNVGRAFSSVRVALIAAAFAWASFGAMQVQAQSGEGACLTTLSGSSRLDQDAGAPPKSLKDSTGRVAIPFVYKQADRKSEQPRNVASGRLEGTEADGDVLALSVDDIRPQRAESTAAYKIALHIPVRQVNRNISKHAFDDGLYKLSAAFSMKVDGAASSFKAGGRVLFFQFWQGAPFHPALTLVIVSDKDLGEGDRGAIEGGARFQVWIANDDHAPSRYHKTEMIRHDLGPVQVDRWIRWEVKLALDPKGKGSVEVLKNGLEAWRSADVQVGFDRNNPQYKPNQRPNPMISSADVMVYRPHWAGKQLIRFKSFTLCAS